MSVNRALSETCAHAQLFVDKRDIICDSEDFDDKV